MWVCGAGVWLRRAGWSCVGRVFSRHVSGREECRGWRRDRLWAAAGGSLLLMCTQAARHTPAACLREGGLFLDPEDDQLTEAHPIEMNEAAALTHTSLLKQSSGVAVDTTMQLLHRTLRATLDFSQQYRKQLQEVINLLEYCTAMLRLPEEHDRIWELLVAARARVDSLKQQLRDLNLLLTYACAAVENTSMAAYISGGEFSASAARQMTDSAKLEITVDERKTQALETQYTQTHTRYIEAAQQVVDEAKTGEDDDMEEDHSGRKMIESESEERKVEGGSQVEGNLEGDETVEVDDG